MESRPYALGKKENKVGSIEISSYDFVVNSIGQRTSVATSGTAFSGASSWSWSYDSLGQVSTARTATSTAPTPTTPSAYAKATADKSATASEPLMALWM